MNFSTGYYGIPSSSKGNFTVHVVSQNGPICGWRPRKEHQFQWCAHRIRLGYVECQTCRTRAQEILRLARLPSDKRKGIPTLKPVKQRRAG